MTLGTGSDAANDAETRASSGDPGNPPPKPRRKPLDNLDRVRREMEATYYGMKHEGLGIDVGKARVYVLGQIVAVLKAAQTAPADDELLGLVEAVRKKMKGST